MTRKVLKTVTMSQGLKFTRKEGGCPRVFGRLQQGGTWGIIALFHFIHHSSVTLRKLGDCGQAVEMESKPWILIPNGINLSFSNILYLVSMQWKVEISLRMRHKYIRSRKWVTLYNFQHKTQQPGQKLFGRKVSGETCTHCGSIGTTDECHLTLKAKEKFYCKWDAHCIKPFRCNTTAVLHIYIRNQDCLMLCEVNFAKSSWIMILKDFGKHILWRWPSTWRIYGLYPWFFFVRDVKKYRTKQRVI